MDDYKTPAEIRTENPAIDWTDQQIGWLLSCCLVRGRKLRRGCLVHRGDVAALHEMRIKIQV